MAHSKKLQFILNKLYELNPDKIELKLDRVQRLINDLGNPHKKLKNVITVTGTNGKGGIAFYLKEILQSHGYTVSLFQSPYLYNFLTRFLINGKPLDEEKFINLVIEVDKVNNNQDITFFEYITCIAFKIFAEANCDFNIIETGLGGKYDSTNVDYQDLKAQVLTPISLDHKDFLGDTLKEITRNKCGIIKDNTNVIIAKQTNEVLVYIEEELRRKKIKKYIFSEDFNVNEENNKKYNYEINNKNIIDNIRIDYIRKVVLENIFNSSTENLDTSNNEIDLLYNIKIKYINLRNIEFNKVKNNFPDLRAADYGSILTFLNKNNLDFFLKEKEINNINKINKRIKENVLSNNNFFIIENEQIKSLIFIEKRFETLEGIIVDLYSVRSQEELETSFLKCENLVKKK